MKNEGGLSFPVDAETLVDILRFRAEHQPDRLAYAFLPDGEEGEERLTYAELHARATALAATLQRMGARGGRALLLYPSGLDYVTAFFGCLCAGTVAVPAYPPRPNRPMPRIHAIVADAGATVALTTSRILAGLERRIADLPDLKALAWRATDEIGAAGASEWRDPGLRRSDLAFLQYTSGSTATPKGVMVSHGNLMHNEELIRRACGHSGETPFVSWLPLYHDLGLIGNLLQALYVGAPCTLMTSVSFLKSPIRWLDAVSRCRAYCSGGPNFAYDLAVRKTTPEQRQGLDLSSWVVAFNGAEPVRRETLERFARAFEPYGFRRKALFPCYGLAETTLIVTAGAAGDGPVSRLFDARELGQDRAVEAADGAAGRDLVGCGKALGDLDVAIVQPETLERLPAGSVGEVWVAGGSVAQGYWNRLDVTAEIFGARTADGSGPYLRTGDLGFLAADGELFITGRRKDLLILRGGNHYPQDIERTVEGSHSALVPGAAAAFAVDAGGEERLVVVQEVQRTERRADVREIAAAVRAGVAAEHELALYGLVLIRPGTIPKTTSGKIQRSRCREELQAGGLAVVSDWWEAPLAAAAPSSQEPGVERWIASLIATATGAQPEEIDSRLPIARYGLDSLRAVELLHAIEAGTGAAPSLESLWGGLTGAELATWAAEALAARETGGEAAGPAGPEAGDHPLTPGQSALWFLDRLEPGNAAYTIASAAEIAGEVDAAALRAAFQGLVDRHPALRTTFPAVGGAPVQRVHASAAVDFSEVEAAGLSDGELRARLAGEAARPFDLENGPLFSVRLFRRGERPPVLLLAVHHIVSDLWSLAVLVRDLGALLGGVPLPDLPLTFADHARQQLAALAGPEGERLAAFWQGALAGELPPLDLPTDRPRPPVQTWRGAAERVALPPALAPALREMGRAAGASPSMTLAAAFAALLHRWAGQDALTLGMPTAGRRRAAVVDLVGYFVNPVVLRTDLAGAPGFGELLGRVRGVALAASEHQDLPFPTLVERLDPERDPSRSPLFQTMFAWQGVPAAADPALAGFALGDEGAEIEAGGLRLRHLPLPQRMAQFELTLTLGEVSGDFAGTLDYNTDLFDPATAARLARSLTVLLASGLADPARPVADLPLLAEEELQEVVHTWNAARAGRSAAPVHRLFAGRAAAAPEAIAVVFRDERVSYGEIDRRSGRLAQRLRALGIGPEDVVGLCAERSPGLIAAVLAILRTGAAYLPLDPEAPAERRAFVLRDAGARALVADEMSGLGRFALEIPVIGLTADGEGTADALPDLGIQPETKACVLYTSGSTGEPKGVVLEHRHLSALVESFAASYAPGPEDAILPLTSVASASFVGEVLPLLAAGGTVVLPGKEEMLGAASILDLAARHGVTILSTVPSLLALLNAAADELPRLRLLLSGGEALAPGDVDRLLGRTAIVNGYGLTETTVCSTVHQLTPQDLEAGRSLPIGRPLPNHRLYVLDGRLAPRPAGCVGEVFVAGEGVARGFAGRPVETALRFLPDPFADGERMYRTGDLARWRSDGSALEYLGRIDQQVKVRGHRIELGEIEAALGRHPLVRESAVALRDLAGEKRLVAWVVPQPEATLRGTDLLAYLRERLPAPMVPAALVDLHALPLNANGKVDTAALPTPERPGAAGGDGAQAAPRSEIERAIAAVWREALGVPRVGLHDNFFDLGGHSLLMAKVHARLREALPGGAGSNLSLIDLFKHPTVAALARSLAGEPEAASTPRSASRPAAVRSEPVDIAVIGLGGRFPGAGNVDELWRNLIEGVESISRFTDEELLAAGVPASLVENPNYVKAKGILGGVDLFDAAFFGLSPRGAELTDPQHRVFLECAWEALESAGYDAARYPGRIGVFAGQSMNTYWLNNLYHHIDLVASLDSLQAAIGNDKDSLTTEVSYRLDLKGPSVLVQSSSSTSLTAVHYACQSLKSGECEMALAGGVSIHLPEVSGYLYHEGGTTDPDGHCRTFDAEAKGFVSGHGAGVVVLKRLADALADGDDVLAVIKGSACNNDGAHKVSYMAPSVDGHAEVVRRAQEAAGVTPDSITYIEAHGTGTLLGDPIEVAALTQAFRAGTDRTGFCAIGSLKTNIGHLDTAAGVAGLIKAVLCLRHRTLPAILHFENPNPKIDFAASPFFVNDRLRRWDVPEGLPRRAGVSSLGMGGTNTHVVLEEAPAPEEVQPARPERPLSLVVVSARTDTALETLTDALADHFRAHPDLAFADAAWTLQTGRKLFPYRRAVVAATAEQAAELLAARDPERVYTALEEARERPVAFLFSGQGSQYPGMGRGLYETEPVFRAEIDRAAGLLLPALGFDLREALYPETDNDPAAAERLRQTAVAQPALFAIEHALARLLMSWGIVPRAFLGHSVGEITAACLAGVFTLEDALGFVAVRGRLMQAMPSGAMLAVSLPEAEAGALAAAHGAALAAVNRPDLTVLSGPGPAIEAVTAALAARGIEGRPLVTSHAFHSSMMDPVMAELREAAARGALQPPRLPFLSNLTGTWIRAEEATDPGYWARQMRGTVRFAAGVAELFAEPGRVLVEVGPGNALATAARQHPVRGAAQPVLTTLRHARERRDDLALLLESLGRLWAAGVPVDWEGFHSPFQPRRRSALPTHPFERRRFWIEPKKVEEAGVRRGPAADLADWFHQPVWKRAAPLPAASASGLARESWLILADRSGVGSRLADRLLAAGAAVAVAPAGEDLPALLAKLAGEGTSPSRIVHLGSLDAGTVEEALDLGFLGLLTLARGLSARGGAARLAVVSSGVHEVTGEEELRPERATLLGAVKVIPREMPDLACRNIDLPGPVLSEAHIERLLAEIASPADDPVTALRGAHRWTQTFEPVRLEKGDGAPRLADGGVYLVTGGLGGIGGALALHLARAHRAKLVLTSRSGSTPAAASLVREIEAAGGEVLAAAADVADRSAMERVLGAARERFGRIDGVFHAAGVPGGGLIERRTREESLAVLAPKVRGTLVLDELLAADPPAFIVLFSSVTALLSQPGQADYAAANAFLDAFAAAAAVRGGPFTLSLDWDAWREVGMAVTTAVPEALRAWREESLRRGIAPAEGIAALERALASPHPWLVVSRNDFAAEVRASFAARTLDEIESAAPERETHARPDLGSAFVAPRGAAEERIATVWQEILGIDRVGAHDNFFDLGGNSLVGLKVISRLKADFGTEVSAVHLLEGPTVAALARLLAPEPQAEEGTGTEVYNERRARGALRREKLRRLRE